MSDVLAYCGKEHEVTAQKKHKLSHEPLLVDALCRRPKAGQDTGREENVVAAPRKPETATCKYV